MGLIYRGDDARTLLIRECKVVISALDELLTSYDHDTLITALYTRLEGYIQKSDLSYELFGKDMVPDEEMATYIPKSDNETSSCRYLIERAAYIETSGTEKEIDDYMVSKLIKYASVVINMSDSIEYLRIPEFIDITVNLDIGDFVDVKVQDPDPFLAFRRIQFTKMKEYGPPPKSSEPHKKVSESVETIRSTNEELMSNRIFSELDNGYRETFGFRFYEHMLVLLAIEELFDEDRNQGLTIIKRNNSVMFSKTRLVLEYSERDLIESIFDKTKFDRETIAKIISFCAINSKQHPIREVLPWNADTAPNRTEIKPLVILKTGNLIFGIPSLFSSRYFISTRLRAGHWPYSDKYLSETLRSALQKFQKKYSESFENSIFLDIKKLLVKSESNIASAKNDKCLVNIRDECPGQLDILSLDPKNKKIILWEVKHYFPEYSARGIVNNIEEFSNPNMKKGYAVKINNKVSFLERHIKEILSFYKIDDYGDWVVTYCMVVSEETLQKRILANKYRIIDALEIENFIKNNYQLPLNGS